MAFKQFKKIIEEADIKSSIVSESEVGRVKSKIINNTRLVVDYRINDNKENINKNIYDLADNFKISGYAQINTIHMLLLLFLMLVLIDSNYHHVFFWR